MSMRDGTCDFHSAIGLRFTRCPNAPAFLVYAHIGRGRYWTYALCAECEAKYRTIRTPDRGTLPFTRVTTLRLNSGQPGSGRKLGPRPTVDANV
jgi:hypothetical protein